MTEECRTLRKAFGISILHTHLFLSKTCGGNRKVLPERAKVAGIMNFHQPKTNPRYEPFLD